MELSTTGLSFFVSYAISFTLASESPPEGVGCMTFSTRMRLARVSLGPRAFCALAVVAAFACAGTPSQARAGCAHYVVSDPQHHLAEALARFDQMLLAGAGPIDITFQAPAPAAPRRSSPCPGGICSQAPPRLPLAPAPRITVRVELWGWLAAPEPCRVPSARRLDLEPPLRLPLGPVASLERPPRPAHTS